MNKKNRLGLCLGLIVSLGVAAYAEDAKESPGVLEKIGNNISKTAKETADQVDTLTKGVAKNAPKQMSIENANAGPKGGAPVKKKKAKKKK